MTILVCPLSRVPGVVAARAPERVVSLLDPEFVSPALGPAYRDRHLRLRFHDIHAPTEGQVMPTAAHVAELLAFLTAWDRSAPLLVHCRAGIGRSPATAFIAACLHAPSADERERAIELRRACPLVRPNETLIALADRAMNRDGRMVAAIAETGRGLPPFDADEGESFELPPSGGSGTVGP
jgi:predicted protein tyrosine phosphatase